MNKKIILFILVLVSICALSHVSAVDDADSIASSDVDLIASPDADTIETQSIEETEESNLDQDNEESSLKDSYRNLQEEINNAENGTTLELSENYTCDYLININKSITIVGVNGGGVIKYDRLENENKTPFFNVNASNVVLKDLKFIGGIYHWSGAIYWQKDNGSIINCEFRQNSASSTEMGIGGAIVMLGNNCNVTNCTFIKNTANMFGGAIVWNGTAGIISNCEFIGNEARGEGKNNGGGALLLWAADNCLIINCTFTDNHCYNYGGAISVLDNNNTRIINCKFNTNYITSGENGDRYKSGGAIFSGCYGLLVDNCSFINNSADTLPGGAISLSDYDIVKNSYFDGNIAKSAFGGRHILGTDGGSYNVAANTFVLEFKENPDYAVNLPIFSYAQLVEDLNNTFIKTKQNSEVDFIGGMVFDYGASGSISVRVTGGTIKSISVLKHPEAIITFSNGVITVSNLVPGTYTLRVTTNPLDDNFASVNGDLSIKVNKATAAIKVQKITVALKKGTLWSIKIVDSRNNKPISGMKLTLKVYTGSKYKTVTITTNSKGVANYQTKSLAAGNHKVVITGNHVGFSLKSVTSYVKVVKQTALSFKVDKKNHAQGASLSITVKNKKTKKALNGVKIKLLIYTKSKLTKTIVLKSLTYQKHKGFAGYSTNQLTVGKHNVKILPVDIKYKGSTKSSLKITKKAKKNPPATFKITAKV